MTPEQLNFVVQFIHPEKILAFLPGMEESPQQLLASIFALDTAEYQKLKSHFAANARRAAKELLADETFAARIDRLPFKPRATVVALGDSITDDFQSWAEILRNLLDLRRPRYGINVVNAGISGETTADLITRFISVVDSQPDWILCMIGTNDARRHGPAASKTLVSLEETGKNLQALHAFAAAQVPAARWAWLTPARVIPALLSRHCFIGPMQLSWRNDELAAVAKVMRNLADGWSEPLVDLQSVFGLEPDAALLMDDGLHPSLNGQIAIVRALVERLSDARARR